LVNSNSTVLDPDPSLDQENIKSESPTLESFNESTSMNSSGKKYNFNNNNNIKNLTSNYLSAGIQSDASYVQESEMGHVLKEDDDESEDQLYNHSFAGTDTFCGQPSK